MIKKTPCVLGEFSCLRSIFLKSSNKTFENRLTAAPPHIITRRSTANNR